MIGHNRSGPALQDMKKRTEPNRNVRVLDLDCLARVNGGDEGDKKPYQLTYKFAPEMLKYESGTGA